MQWAAIVCRAASSRSFRSAAARALISAGSASTNPCRPCSMISQAPLKTVLMTGKAHGQRLQHDQAARIVPGRKHEQVGGTIKCIGVGGFAGEDHAIGHALLLGEFAICRGSCFPTTSSTSRSSLMRAKPRSPRPIPCEKVLSDHQGDDAIGGRCRSCRRISSRGLRTGGGVETLQVRRVEQRRQSVSRQRIMPSKLCFTYSESTTGPEAAGPSSNSRSTAAKRCRRRFIRLANCAITCMTGPSYFRCPLRMPRQRCRRADGRCRIAEPAASREQYRGDGRGRC